MFTLLIMAAQHVDLILTISVEGKAYQHQKPFYYCVITTGSLCEEEPWDKECILPKASNAKGLHILDHM